MAKFSKITLNNIKFKSYKKELNKKMNYSKLSKTNQKNKKMTEILVLCAHNDDQVIGVGGTLAKYAKEGKKFKTIVFTHGAFHLYFKKKIISKIREREGEKSDRLLKGSLVINLELKDMSLKKELTDEKIKQKIIKIIKKEKPKKIFTHSSSDSHPDHKAVHNLVKELIKNKVINCEVYSFDVWTIFNPNRNTPKLVVDVSKTFEKKLEAIFTFKSQKNIIWTLMFHICLKAIVNGWIYKYKYAEVFNKIN